MRRALKAFSRDFAVPMIVCSALAGCGSGSCGGSTTALPPVPRFVLVSNTDSVSVYSADGETGTLRPHRYIPLGPAGSARPFAFDASRNVLYVGNTFMKTISALALDPITGMISTVNGSPFPTTSDESAIAVDP